MCFCWNFRLVHISLVLPSNCDITRMPDRFMRDTIFRGLFPERNLSKILFPHVCYTYTTHLSCTQPIVIASFVHCIIQMLEMIIKKHMSLLLLVCWWLVIVEVQFKHTITIKTDTFYKIFVPNLYINWQSFLTLIVFQNTDYNQ